MNESEKKSWMCRIIHISKLLYYERMHRQIDELFYRSTVKHFSIWINLSVNWRVLSKRFWTTDRQREMRLHKHVHMYWCDSVRCAVGDVFFHSLYCYFSSWSAIFSHNTVSLMCHSTKLCLLKTHFMLPHRAVCMSFGNKRIRINLMVLAAFYLTLILHIEWETTV